MIPAERVPSASLLLRHRDDRGRSPTGSDRDGPVPAPRRRPLRGRSVPGGRGMGVGGEAGDPDGPRQGRPRAHLGFRPGREPAALRPHVPHRTRDEVEADRVGPREAEVLLVHEALCGPGANPRDAEPRLSLGIEPAQFLGQGERGPGAAHVPCGPVFGHHRLRDAGEERRGRPPAGRSERPGCDGRSTTQDSEPPGTGSRSLTCLPGGWQSEILRARLCGSHALIMAAHNSLCTGTIWLAGTEAQKRKYIPDLASGRKIGAWALTEPTSGSDAAAMVTTAKRKKDGWVLNGTKTFCTNA